MDPLYRDLCEWTRKAVDNYSNQDVAESYRLGTPLSECGDTLFVFIIRECEDAEDAEEAAGMMERAAEQLSNVGMELLD